VRAARVESEIPLDPFTAGVYVATMMATVQTLREKVPEPGFWCKTVRLCVRMSAGMMATMQTLTWPP
jgi:hypothetical protein